MAIVAAQGGQRWTWCQPSPPSEQPPVQLLRLSLDLPPLLGGPVGHTHCLEPGEVLKRRSPARRSSSAGFTLRSPQGTSPQVTSL